MESFKIQSSCRGSVQIAFSLLPQVRTPMVVQQPQVQPQVQQVQPQVQQQPAVPTAQASQIVGSGVQVRAFVAKSSHNCWQVPVHLCVELDVRHPTVRGLVGSGAVWEPVLGVLEVVSSAWSYLSPLPLFRHLLSSPFPPSLRTRVGEESTVVSASPRLGVQGWQPVYGSALETEERQHDGARRQRTAQACATAPRSAGCQDWPSVPRSVPEAFHAHPLCIGC